MVPCSFELQLFCRGQKFFFGMKIVCYVMSSCILASCLSGGTEIIWFCDHMDDGCKMGSGVEIRTEA